MAASQASGRPAAVSTFAEEGAEDALSFVVGAVLNPVERPPESAATAAGADAGAGAANGARADSTAVASDFVAARPKYCAGAEFATAGGGACN